LDKKLLLEYLKINNKNVFFALESTVSDKFMPLVVHRVKKYPENNSDKTKREYDI